MTSDRVSLAAQTCAASDISMSAATHNDSTHDSNSASLIKQIQIQIKPVCNVPVSPSRKTTGIINVRQDR